MCVFFCSGDKNRGVPPKALIFAAASVAIVVLLIVFLVVFLRLRRKKKNKNSEHRHESKLSNSDMEGDFSCVVFFLCLYPLFQCSFDIFLTQFLDTWFISFLYIQMKILARIQ